LAGITIASRMVFASQDSSMGRKGTPSRIIPPLK
jgi:hypothetical protein